MGKVDTRQVDACKPPEELADVVLSREECPHRIGTRGRLPPTDCPRRFEIAPAPDWRFECPHEPPAQQSGPRGALSETSCGHCPLRRRSHGIQVYAAGR